MQLTPKQLKELQEIEADRQSADLTLKIALGFHSNQIARCNKLKEGWWDEMRATHGLDDKKSYRVNFAEAVIEVVEDTNPINKEQ